MLNPKDKPRTFKPTSGPIRAGALQGLLDDEFLNDSVIEMCMLFLTRRETLSAVERKRVQPMGSFLYSRMLNFAQSSHKCKKEPENWSVAMFDSAFTGVSTWNRSCGLFTKSSLFNAVEYNKHWSLLTILNAPALHAYLESVDRALRSVSGVPKPGVAVPTVQQHSEPPAPPTLQRYFDAISTVALPQSRPLLLHADSSAHKLERICAVYRNYLVREWHLQCNGGEPVGGCIEAQNALGAFGCPDGWADDGTLRGGHWLVILPGATLRGAPKQEDGSGCGVHTVLNTMSTLKMLRGPWASGCGPLSPERLAVAALLWTGPPASPSSPRRTWAPRADLSWP